METRGIAALLANRAIREKCVVVLSRRRAIRDNPSFYPRAIETTSHPRVTAEASCGHVDA